MDRRNRRLFVVGSLLYLGGTLLNLVAQFAEIRGLLVVALLLSVGGVVLLLIAATRYVNGRRNR